MWSLSTGCSEHRANYRDTTPHSLKYSFLWSGAMFWKPQHTCSKEEKCRQYSENKETPNHIFQLQMVKKKWETARISLNSWKHYPMTRIAQILIYRLLTLVKGKPVVKYPLPPFLLFLSFSQLFLLFFCNGWLGGPTFLSVCEQSHMPNQFSESNQILHTLCFNNISEYNIYCCQIRIARPVTESWKPVYLCFFVKRNRLVAFSKPLNAQGF